MKKKITRIPIRQNKYNKPRTSPEEKQKMQELIDLLGKKKMFVIQTILLNHYKITPTDEILKNKVVREVNNAPGCRLPERFYLLPEGVNSPEEAYRGKDPNKPKMLLSPEMRVNHIASFAIELVHDAKMVEVFKYRSNLIFDTPNNDLIDLSEDNQVLQDFTGPKTVQP